MLIITKKQRDDALMLNEEKTKIIQQMREDKDEEKKKEEEEENEESKEEEEEEEDVEVMLKGNSMWEVSVILETSLVSFDDDDDDNEVENVDVFASSPLTLGKRKSSEDITHPLLKKPKTPESLNLTFDEVHLSD